MRPIAAVILLALALAGCAKKPFDRDATPETSVEVQNNNFYDMNLYIVRAGQRTRLGFINSGQTRTFRIPVYLAEGSTRIQFLADPVGGNRTPTTQEIFVTPGETVRLVIPSF
ncbi:MAG: hypothetical protein R2834_02970 [Rhodothermales bacterium]